MTSKRIEQIKQISVACALASVMWSVHTPRSIHASCMSQIDEYLEVKVVSVTRDGQAEPPGETHPGEQLVLITETPWGGKESDAFRVFNPKDRAKFDARFETNFKGWDQ